MSSVVEFQWSDLARRSPDVGDALDADGEVIVTRGSRSYRIAQLGHETAIVLQDFSRLLAALVATASPDQVRATLNAAWAWTRILPDADQLTCAHEVGSLAETCESLHSWKPLVDSIEAWRGTARAWASGATPGGPVSTSSAPVARP